MVECCFSKITSKVYAVKDNQTFYNRLVCIGVCPICKKTILQLTETRYSDNKTFTTILKGRKAKHTLRELRPHFIKHIRTNIKYGTFFNNNWRFGKTTISRKYRIVKAINFNGQSETIYKHTT
jgi:hypothetical protein